MDLDRQADFFWHYINTDNVIKCIKRILFKVSGKIIYSKLADIENYITFIILLINLYLLKIISLGRSNFSLGLVNLLKFKQLHILQ